MSSAPPLESPIILHLTILPSFQNGIDRDEMEDLINSLIVSQSHPAFHSISSFLEIFCLGLFRPEDRDRKDGEWLKDGRGWGRFGDSKNTIADNLPKLTEASKLREREASFIHLCILITQSHIYRARNPPAHEIHCMHKFYAFTAVLTIEITMRLPISTSTFLPSPQKGADWPL